DWAAVLLAALRRRLAALPPGPELVFFQHDEGLVHCPEAAGPRGAGGGAPAPARRPPARPGAGLLPARRGPGPLPGSGRARRGRGRRPGRRPCRAAGVRPHLGALPGRPRCGRLLRRRQIAPRPGDRFPASPQAPHSRPQAGGSKLVACLGETPIWRYGRDIMSSFAPAGAEPGGTRELPGGTPAGAGGGPAWGGGTPSGPAWGGGTPAGPGGPRNGPVGGRWRLALALLLTAGVAGTVRGGGGGARRGAPTCKGGGGGA